MAEVAESKGMAEAIAVGYRNHGEGVFHLLGGGFCTAIVDTSAQRVLLGIDRLGQHSLYYVAQDGHFAFGSEALSALRAGSFKAPLSPQGVYNYVYFHMVPAGGTVYTPLKKLPAAHYLVLCDQTSQPVNYWQPSFNETESVASEDQLAEELLEKLRVAVSRCAKDEKTTAAFLSGGLDSSTVTGVLSEISHQRAAAFSIGFSADGYDEMAFARITANHFDVDLNEYYVTPEDVVKALPMVAASYDEPFGNSSALPAYFCAKVAADKGVKLLLAGDGGDEIFAGNERYIRQNVFEHYKKLPRAVRTGLIEPLTRLLPGAFPLANKARSYIEQANTPLPERLQSYNFLHRHRAQDIFCEDFLRAISPLQPLTLQKEIFQRPDSATDLNRMLYMDWQITLADNDLRKVSHMCALAGVDVAYPMLDDDLVSLSCRIPSHWKIQKGDLRYFFKRATGGWLPSDTINKSKQGFGLPFGVWMQSFTPLRELAYDNLEKLKSRRLIKPEFIDQTVRMHGSEHAAYYGELVWIFAVFELWLSAHENDIEWVH
ncbi:MAG: asparagine synthase C-terminal domain-containing protein [Pseudomonadota bacterium]